MPDYAKTPFSLSGVFLTHRPRPCVRDGKHRDRLERAAAGAAGCHARVQSRPTRSRGSPRCTTTRRTHLTGSRSRARFRTRSDGRTIVQSRDTRVVQRRGQGHGFTTDYPLRDLKPGPYVLRVEADVDDGRADGAARPAVRGEIDHGPQRRTRNGDAKSASP